MSREDLKAKLMAQFEAELDQMLTETTAASEISLDEIEERSLEAGRTVREMILQELVSEAGDEEPIPAAPMSCPKCGQRMHRKGRRSKDIVTRAGETEMERLYFYCGGCGHSIFPPR